jgi:hypothetical protein
LFLSSLSLFLSLSPYHHRVSPISQSGCSTTFNFFPPDSVSVFPFFFFPSLFFSSLSLSLSLSLSPSHHSSRVRLPGGQLSSILSSQIRRQTRFSFLPPPFITEFKFKLHKPKLQLYNIFSTSQDPDSASVIFLLAKQGRGVKWGSVGGGGRGKGHHMGVFCGNDVRINSPSGVGLSQQLSESCQPLLSCGGHFDRARFDCGDPSSKTLCRLCWTETTLQVHSG